MWLGKHADFGQIWRIRQSWLEQREKTFLMTQEFNLSLQ
jgi:hypothetical protein